METVETDETLVPSAAPAQLFGHIEILNRSGAVLRRIPLSDGVLRLGRQLDNDIILDDPYVCPHHAQLTVVDGQLRVEDRLSINGIARALGQPRLPVLVLTSGESLRIGHTTLRYCSIDHPLEPTLVDRSLPGWLRLLERPATPAILLGVTVVFLLLQEWFTATTKIEGFKLVLEPLATVVLILSWGAGWAFVSRLVTHRWNYRAHLGIACGVILGSLVLGALAGYFCFALNLDQLQELVDWALLVAVVGLLLYGHLRFASLAAPKRLAQAAGAISLALLALLLLVAKGKEGDFDADPNYTVTLKAPLFKLAPSRSVPDFFAEMATLPAQLKKSEEAKP